jgi:glucose/arabinose dehydrogenase/plastocyanin
LPTGFTEQTFSGISEPTNIAIAPDGRVFVGEQCGKLRIIKNGAVLATAFATLPVVCDNERGLHGIAFDPNFETNGFVYVRFTRASPIGNVIGRLHVSGGNPDVSDGTVTIIFTIPFRNNVFHHGGGLQVGNDGKLYSSIGDHRSGSGQNLDELWGKVIRINIPDGSIPSDNPFFGTTTGDNRAIWAYGFRNPFTMDIEPGTGRIFVNDVGDGASSCCEEVNLLTRGMNYGWPPASNGAGNYFRYTASSTDGGNAITGGDFYRPQNVMFPASFVGKYFFGDYGGGWIKTINGTGGPGPLTNFASGINGPTDVEVHFDGSLWYTAHDGNQVRRVIFGTPGPTPTPTRTPTPTPMGPTPTPTPTSRPNNPPVPSITAPTDAVKYKGGDTISFAGDCTDAQDGVEPAARLSWSVVFHHTDHTHGQTNFPGVKGGSFTTPTDDEWDPIQWFRITNTCTDSNGAMASVFHDVQPDLRRLTVASSPTGLQVAADGLAGAAPVSGDAIINVTRALSTTGPQTMGGTTYFFQSWSDGGAKAHNVLMPAADTTYTARFQPASAYTEVTPSNPTASTSDANVPANTVDNNLATRWSAVGDGQWIQFDLGSMRQIGHVNIAVYQGNARRNRFELQTANAAAGPWTTVFSGESSGTTLNEEPYDFADVSARFIRYLGHGNIGAPNPTVNSVTEISIFARTVAPNTVSIMNFAFQPATLTINPGDTVTWVNNDTAAHTSTSDTGVWDSGTLASGQSFSFTFTSPGSFPYHCEFHPGMLGTIVVNGPTPTPTPTPTRTPTPTPTSPVPTVTPTPTSSQPPTPTPTPTPIVGECVEAAVTATASTNDGNVAANAIDNDLATRWSGNGDGATLTLDLGSVKTVCFVRVAWFQGDTRMSRFDLQKASSPTGTFSNIATGLNSSGTTLNDEMFDFADTDARVIRYLGHGNNSATKPTWNSVTEISVFVRTGAPLPTATPTPTSSTPRPTPTPTATPSGTGAPTAAELLAKLQNCVQDSNGLFKTDSENSRTIPVCRLNGAYWWRADMDIDCDGVTTTQCNKNTDPAYQNDTSLHTSGGQPFNAATMPFVVIPSTNSTWNFSQKNIQLGAVFAVVFNNRIEYGVFADTGPTDIIGEASYAMATNLGIDHDPANGGTDGPVWYVVFPGTHASPVESHTNAVSQGQALARTLINNN